MVLFKVYLLFCLLVIFSRTVQFAIEYGFEKSKTWCEFYGMVDNSDVLNSIKDEYIDDIKTYIPYILIFAVVAFIVSIII